MKIIIVRRRSRLDMLKTQKVVETYSLDDRLSLGTLVSNKCALYLQMRENGAAVSKGTGIDAMGEGRRELGSGLMTYCNLFGCQGTSISQTGLRG